MNTPPPSTAAPPQVGHGPAEPNQNQNAALAPDLPVRPGPPRLAYSVRETAEILGISEKTVRRLVARKLLRSSNALRHLLIPKKEIERFLDETSV